jgi:hypothetical protein
VQDPHKAEPGICTGDDAEKQISTGCDNKVILRRFEELLVRLHDIHVQRDSGPGPQQNPLSIFRNSSDNSLSIISPYNKCDFLAFVLLKCWFPITGGC